MSRTWYERHIRPHALDYACGLPTVGFQRQLMVPQASGRRWHRMNMRYYDKTRVTKITAPDPATKRHPLAALQECAACPRPAGNCCIASMAAHLCCKPQALHCPSCTPATCQGLDR